MSYDQILSMSPRELLDWLIANFYTEIPQALQSKEDMEKASELLLKLASNYSYLSNLLSFAKINARELKRFGDKTMYEDAVDKKESIQNTQDAVKQQYQALSRAVTIYIQQLEELKMMSF